MSQYLKLTQQILHNAFLKKFTNLSVETDQCLVLLWATQFRRLINLERSCCVGDGNIGSVINAYQVFFDGHIKAHSYCDVSRFPFHAIRPLDRTLKNILIERLPFESHLVTTSVLSNLVQFRTWYMILSKWPLSRSDGSVIYHKLHTLIFDLFTQYWLFLTVYIKK